LLERVLPIFIKTKLREQVMTKKLFATIALSTVLLSPVAFATDNHKATTSEESAAKNLATDTAITTAVKAKLATEDSLKTLVNVKVETTNMHVHLSGTVPNQEAHSLAVKIAKEVENVHSVEASNLVVQPNHK
jgi:osmotically-inducible protein OsmY